MSEALGKTIRILRQAKDLTITEAARRCKISASFLSLVESGTRQPSISVLRRIADALGIPSEALLLAAMQSDGGLVAKDEESNRITAVVEELLAIEDKLRRLLKEKGNRRGTGGRHTG